MLGIQVREESARVSWCFLEKVGQAGSSAVINGVTSPRPAGVRTGASEDASRPGDDQSRSLTDV